MSIIRSRVPGWIDVAAWRASALKPIDAASLAFFRIALGLCVLADASRKGDHFFNSNDGKEFRFAYEGFAWVPSAGEWGPLLNTIWAIAALLMILGLFYRPAIIVITVLTTFGFLQAQENYLNHYYLLIIVCFLMCFVPANRAFSLDAHLLPSRFKPAPLRNMHHWLLKAQAEIVLVYAGIVKLNSDWLQLEPLRSWLQKRHANTIFDMLWQNDWGVACAAYGVTALHLIGAPLLLCKRTRLPVALVYIAFHMSNHFTFEIGIFPWMTIALTTLFFDPDWPRRLLGSLSLPADPGPTLTPNRWAHTFMAFAGIWIFLQAVIPLRHYAYEGDVAWTYEGHHFAWRMKLVDRWSPGIVAVAYVPEKNVLLIPPLKNLMSKRQFEKVTTRPPLARQLGPQLAQKIRASESVSEVKVHLFMPVGYNNREAVPLINPKVDFASDRIDDGNGYWLIRENSKPLRRREEFSKKFNFPAHQELAQLMGLPQPSLCRQREDLWVECQITPEQQISFAR
ncbi:MAG: HTTM domain-containing protein [Hyphomicrobium sp.]|mgnify:CR=1 FL=1